MNPTQLMKLMADQGLLNTVAFLKDWQVSTRMYFLYAGIETGLFKALREPCSKEILIERLAPKRLELFEALLEMGVAISELSFKNGEYRLKGRRSKTLSDDPDEIFTGIVQANVTYYHIAFHDAAERMAGGPLADLLDTYAETIAKFSRSTEPFVADFLRQALERRGAVRLLEIGCGSGVHLRSALSANPEVFGTGVEVDPRVAERARQNLAAWGIEDRFSIVRGDIRDNPGDVARAYDIVTLFNLVYYFEETERVSLFRKLKERLSEGGTFLMVTMVSSKGKDAMAAALNVATVSDRGTTALPDEQVLADQLREAGFPNVSWKRIMPRSSFLGFISS